jgi:hypothetical protein
MDRGWLADCGGSRTRGRAFDRETLGHGGVPGFSAWVAAAVAVVAAAAGVAAGFFLIS